MAVNYRPNHTGLREVLRSDRMSEVITDAGEMIASRARANAPVLSGALRDSIRVAVDQHPTRVVAHVGVHVNYGLVIESRTHFLRRALG